MKYAQIVLPAAFCLALFAPAQALGDDLVNTDNVGEFSYTECIPDPDHDGHDLCRECNADYNCGAWYSKPCEAETRSPEPEPPECSWWEWWC